MSTGLSFCLCLIVVSMGGSILLARAIRRLDELDVIEKRKRAWARLDLPDAEHEKFMRSIVSTWPDHPPCAHPPPCLRELDPSGPFDWQALDG